MGRGWNSGLPPPSSLGYKVLGARQFSALLQTSRQPHFTDQETEAQGKGSDVPPVSQAAERGREDTGSSRRSSGEFLMSWEWGVASGRRWPQRMDEGGVYVRS